jgi:hypothetical protein
MLRGKLIEFSGPGFTGIRVGVSFGGPVIETAAVRGGSTVRGNECSGLGHMGPDPD